MSTSFLRKSLSVLSLVTLSLLSVSIAANESQAAYGPDSQVEDFSLLNTAGTRTSLKQKDGTRGWIIVFTCNHSEYSALYEDRIIALHKKYAPLGFSVIAINPDTDSPTQIAGDSYKEMKKRAKLKNYPFPYLYDAKQAVSKKFGAQRTPQVYVLDSDRIVRYVGAIDDYPELESQVKTAYVQAAVDSLLAGRKPEPAQTRPVGNLIRY